MNVLLLNPPRTNEIVANNPRVVDEVRSHNPPLGLLYIAAYLEQHSQHTIRVIDCQVEGFDSPELQGLMHDFNPDVVGLTAMTMTLLDVLGCIRIIKKHSPATKIVLGGPHATIYPRETIALEEVDYVITGEGEVALKQLLEALEQQTDLHAIPGLLFKNNGHTIQTGAPAVIKELDVLPFPARHHVPYTRYDSVLMKRSPVTTIMTSRGCPYQCSFCDRPFLMNRFRTRSADNVVSELETCVDMGIRDFLFYDDTFTIQKQRVLDICEQIQSRNLDICFDIRARVDTVDLDLLKALKKAGCQGIHYGVEAGSDKILRVLNKGITTQQVKEAFQLTKKANIPTLAYFIIGNPTETRHDIQSSFDLIKELRPDYLHLSILIPFPGTQIYTQGLLSGQIQTDHWRQFANSPSIGFVPPHWDECFSREELDALLVKAYTRFYLRPSYILKRLLQLKSLGELAKNFRAGFKIAVMKRF